MESPHEPEIDDNFLPETEEAVNAAAEAWDALIAAVMGSLNATSDLCGDCEARGVEQQVSIDRLFPMWEGLVRQQDGDVVSAIHFGHLMSEMLDFFISTHDD